MNRTIDQIADHLELLGYSTERKGPQKAGEKYMVLVDHPTKVKFVALEFSPNIIWFQANLNTEKKVVVEMSDFANELNRNFLISKLFYDAVEGLAVIRFRAVYTGAYAKDIFGQFWEAIQNDLQQLFTLDGKARIFSNEIS
jgi:hypothetical protein